MKVSYLWLSEYIDLSGCTAQDLAEKLTRSGIEVDIVESRNLGVDKVVVGYVKAREKHPDADKLSVCTVDVGGEQDLQIVCGAKNVDAGQKVPVAVVGAVLPGDFRIKRAKLRGVESQGMICSAKELGLNDKLLPKEIQEGIMVLPEDTAVGEPILDVLAIDDHVLELDLTPNRSDALSMLGVAYEIAAILGREVKLPSEAVEESSAVKAAERFDVGIRADDACDMYTARYIEGVKIAASPLWLQNRLMAAGIRPINNIVDITNYVMLEYGQPLHAFDADRLEGGRIEARFAREGEIIVSLDDTERKLEPHMLVIADAVKPVAIAGVMGGANSEVTASTTRILLESAKFDGVTVRKTSRQLGLRSESSLRFEKEVDPERVLRALNRAASLISRLAGGTVAQGVVQAVERQAPPVVVSVSAEQVNAYLGTALTVDEIREIFDRLNFSYEQAGDALQVTVPSRRGDIRREVDLFEEIARLHGYDHIPTTLMSGITTPGSLTREQTIRRAIRRLLSDSGLQEVVTYSLTSVDQLKLVAGFYPEAQPIRLAMPMSEDRSTLRTSLIPQLMATAVYNRNRNNDHVAVFEVGSVFITEERELTKLPEEKPHLAMLWTGRKTAAHWSGKSVPVDFYDLKGIVEKLFAYLGIDAVSYEPAQPEGFHPGRTAAILLEQDGVRRQIGVLGQLHPALQKEQDLEDTYVLELALAPVYACTDETIIYRPLPRFPASSRDMALVLDQAVDAGQMIAKAKEAAGSILESIEIFDIYTGDRVGDGKKSVALSLVYRHPDRTLTDEEVTEVHAKVVQTLEQTFSAELRK